MRRITNGLLCRHIGLCTVFCSVQINIRCVTVVNGYSTARAGQAVASVNNLPTDVRIYLSWTVASTTYWIILFCSISILQCKTISVRVCCSTNWLQYVHTRTSVNVIISETRFHLPVPLYKLLRVTVPLEYTRQCLSDVGTVVELKLRKMKYDNHSFTILETENPFSRKAS